MIKSLTTEELLRVWEQSLNQTTLHKALSLLCAANPDWDLQTVAQFSIGRRDELLLQMREQMFGSRLVNSVVCPQCSERVEWENQIDDLREPDTLPLQDDGASLHHSLAIADYTVEFRLPNSLDVIHVLDMPGNGRSNGPSNDQAQTEMLKRCIIAARKTDGESDRKPDSEIEASSLPAFVLDALGDRMEALDPQADINIRLNCPQCAWQWQVVFDITSFLWAEIDRWAERTLQTVHLLAASYGWSEQAILSLSPVRRALYLRLARS